MDKPVDTSDKRRMKMEGYKRDLLLESQLRLHLNTLNFLMKLGCCPRCAFRLVNMRNYALYREDPQFLMDMIREVDVSVTEKHPPESVCVACLGIMQHASDHQFLQSITNAMKDSGFSYEDYALSISLPLSVYVRNHALWLHLRDIFQPKPSVDGKEADQVNGQTQKRHANLFKEELPEKTVVDVKECLKWIVGEHIKQTLGFDFKFMSDFKVLLTFDHPQSLDEIQFLANIDGSPLKPKRKRSRDAVAPPPTPEISIPTLQKFLMIVPPAVFLKHGQCPPAAVHHGSATHMLNFEHCPVYVAGRYIKHSRDLSQTAWLIEGKRMSESSIEELISPCVMKRFRGDTITFSSAGREDVDVRMMDGRPFVLEVSNPRVPDLTEAQFLEIQEEINKSTDRVQVKDLQRVSKADLSKLKEGEETKKKTYRCVVWISKAITPKDLEFLHGIKDLVLQQKTPVRVLHRRSLAVRPKVIHSISYEYINEHFLILDLVTQAGTYIKEFIHGDLGRTQPNFGTLMNCQADILQLDVISIDVDFPPTLSDSK